MEPYVITQLCRNCLHGDCLDVCPVDSIVRFNGPEHPAQLYITADCISCGSCVPECPEEAIFEKDDVPDEFESDIELGRIATMDRSRISVPSRLDLIAMLGGPSAQAV